MKKIETPISNLYIIEPEVYEDDRGYFFESFNADKFDALGIAFTPHQESQSGSKKGIVRGIHFQHVPKAMAKLVRCPAGRLWDVAVDLRPNSPTYKKWYGLELSEENHRMLFIPEGFGHGFYAHTDCQLSYLISNTFDKELDAGIAWNDPTIGIEWPLEGDPLLSLRDQRQPLLDEIELQW